MTLASRWRLLAVICLVYLSVVIAADETNLKSTVNNKTGTIDSTAVQLSDETAFAVCRYPTSGSYSALNRILYYCTLVFALFSRAHLWLVAGALATALTYSGVAAIHACLLAWRGPNPYAETEVWALITILGTASLITVPLLSWSGTLRRLGSRFADTRDTQTQQEDSHAGARTIVIYWAFLVLVGYISVWQTLSFPDPNSDLTEMPDINKVFCRPGTNSSMFNTADGSTRKRVIDADFITLNGCNNPCELITVPALFRQNTDLVLLTYKQALLYTGALTGEKYEGVNQILVEQGRFDFAHQLILPVILLQGFISVCFGRRNPREIRDLIYIKLALDHPLFETAALLAVQDWSARIIAGFSYVMAALMVLVCPPLFIGLIIDQEWTSTYLIPDSEPMTAVGQWGPWAVAIQAILAALISRYHDRAVRHVADACRKLYRLCRKNSNRQVYQAVHQQQLPTASATDTPDLESATKTADKTKVSVSYTSHPLVPEKSSPSKTKRPWYASFALWVVKVLKVCVEPLIHIVHRLLNEVKNSIRWCRDPRQMSQRVVRHPVRPDDDPVLEIGEDTGLPRNESVKTSQMRRESGFFRAASERRPQRAPRQQDAESYVLPAIPRTPSLSLQSVPADSKHSRVDE